MKNRKTITMLLIACLLLAACASSKEATEATTEAVTEEVTEAATEATTEEVSGDSGEGLTGEVVIQDVVGRTVALDAPASKLVGTHNPTLNAVVVIGGGDKYLAGFGNKKMSKVLYDAVIPDFENFPQIGKGSEINYETVVEVGADLAVLPERFANLVEQFEAVGVPAIVALPNDESFESVKESLLRIGSAVGATDRAEEINAYLDAKIEDAKKIAEQDVAEKKVLFLGGSSVLSVAPDALIQTELIEAAGGINAVEGIDEKGGFVDVDLEQIIAWNPDVIWFPGYADYDAQSILDDPAWAEITAVKNNEVYAFPSPVEPWDQPTAAVALGVSWATHSLHPELKTLEDVIADADEFYTFVYGKTFTPEEMGLK